MKALISKNYIGWKIIALASLIAGTIIGASLADTSSDDQWRAQQTKYDLLDREKSLLKKDDDLSRHIYDIKLSIKTLTDALFASQSELDRVRHELIIIHVKLLK